MSAGWKYECEAAEMCKFFLDTALRKLFMPTVHLVYFKSVKPLVYFVRMNAGKAAKAQDLECSVIWSLIVGIRA